MAGVVAAIVPAVVYEFPNLGPTLTEAGDDIEDWLVDGPLDLKRRECASTATILATGSKIAAGSSGGVMQERAPSSSSSPGSCSRSCSRSSS